MLTPAEFWNDQPVIPVIVINNADKAVELAQTLVASGIKKFTPIKCGWMGCIWENLFMLNTHRLLKMVNN